MPRFLFVVVSLLLISGWGAASEAAEPFRPEAGKFPPLKKAHSYRGELIFVDHANRRGSLRVEGTGKFGSSLISVGERFCEAGHDTSGNGLRIQSLST
jgi:hypothetical protein